MGYPEFRCELCNGGGEVSNGCVIGGCCRSEVGNGFDGLCFKRCCFHNIGAVDGAGCGLLVFLPIVVAFGEEGLEAGPVFCKGTATVLPIVEIVTENTGGLDKTVDRVEYGVFSCAAKSTASWICLMRISRGWLGLYGLVMRHLFSRRLAGVILA